MDGIGFAANLFPSLTLFPCIIKQALIDFKTFQLLKHNFKVRKV